jgi:hypothetical protein
VLERLTALRDFDCTQDLSPMQLVQLGLCDAVKIMIKGDPHKLSKIAEERYRLIFCVSLICNVIARLLFANQNNTEISIWDQIPSKPGMGLNDSGLRTLIQNAIDSELDSFDDNDVSGWDWSIHAWELENALEMRINANNSRGTVWERVARAHYYCICRKVMVLSDGTMYQQLTPGIMPSGWYNTSGDNSRMRVFLHWLLVTEKNLSLDQAKQIVAWIMSMGDDSVERNLGDMVALYNRYGKNIKMNKATPSKFEFCSTLFIDGLGYPSNVDKQLVNFLCYPYQNYAQAAERFDQFTYEMRNHPDLPELLHLIDVCGWWDRCKDQENDRRSGGSSSFVPMMGPRADVIVQCRADVESGVCQHLRKPNYGIGSQVKCPKSLRVLIKMPRDCTEQPHKWCFSDAQSRSSLRYPIQMTKRKNKTAGSNVAAKITSLEKTMKALVVGSKQKKKKTPFKDTGAIVGSKIGGMFGNSSLGSGIGKWLGTGIGTMFGSGDYHMSGPNPKYNVITNGSQIPQFSTTRQTNIVCHREYLGDITGTAGFLNTPYILNPGVSSTFPWLSSVAANYQEYRFHGLVFEFRPLITDFVTSGAPGVVIMATNYNSDAVDYTSKQQMENSEFAVSVKPTLNLVHGIECAAQQTILPTKFVRTGSVPVNQDLRLYDQGIFQFATQQNPTQDLGELWVSYCVEFFKPILPVVESEPSSGFHALRSTVSSAAPLGLIQVRTNGTLPVIVTGNQIAISNAAVGSTYLVDIIYESATAVSITQVAPALVGCALDLFFNNATTGIVYIPNNGVTSQTANMQFAISPTSIDGPSTMIMNFLNTSISYPGGFIDIFINLLDPSVSG